MESYVFSILVDLYCSEQAHTKESARTRGRASEGEQARQRVRQIEQDRVTGNESSLFVHETR